MIARTSRAVLRREPIGPIRTLDSSWLFRRIAVRPPYYALTDCRSAEPGSAFACLPRYGSPRFERTPLSTAEASRHLAVIGSCAIATLMPDDGVRYFLAAHASVRRGGALDWTTSGPLLLSAHASLDGRRRAAARSRLFDTRGDLVFDAQISYHVLTKAAFERHFAAHRYTGQPSAGTSVELESLELSPTVARARLSRIAPQLCNGHFPDFPALSIADLAGLLIEVGHPLLDQLSPGARWLFRKATIQADKLTFASSSVDLVVQRSAGEPTRLLASAVDEAGNVVAHGESTWDRASDHNPAAQKENGDSPHFLTSFCG